MLVIGSLKYARDGKNNDKNPSSLFRPVDSWDWAKTWLNSG